MKKWCLFIALTAMSWNSQAQQSSVQIKDGQLELDFSGVAIDKDHAKQYTIKRAKGRFGN